MPDTDLTAQQQRHDAGTAYRIIRAMFVVLFFWVFWKFGGYLITAAVVRTFGSGVETDAYFFVTQTAVYVLVFAPALSILVPAFMPVFIEERNLQGERSAWRFAGTVMTLVLIGSVLLVVAMYAWGPAITETLVGGFPGATRALGVSMLWWVMPGAALMAVFLVLRCLLNSYKIFSYPSAAEAAQKGVWFVVLLATAGIMGIYGAAVGLLVGSLAMVLIAAWGLRDKLGLLKLGFPAMDGRRAVREMLIGAGFLLATGVALWAVNAVLPAGFADYKNVVLMTVALLAVLVYCGTLWRRAGGGTGPMARFALLAVPLGISAFFATYREVVTRQFQSFAATGVYSDIEAAKKIANFPTELIALALSVAMLPYLCELASRKNREMLGDIVTKALRMLAVGFVPLTVLTIVLAEPVVRLVLDRGDRDLVHIRYTAIALQVTALGFVVYAAERVIMQAYISLQRVWAPALLGIAATILQVGFLSVAVYALGMNYPEQIFWLVAIAYPLSRLAKNTAMLLLLKRHVTVLPAPETLVFGAKLLGISALIGLAAWAALRATEGALPYEQFLQKKVIVDNFEALPATWYSVDADSVMLSAEPDGGPGAAVAFTYKRHLDRVVPLARKLEHVDTSGATALSLRLWSERPTGPMRAWTGTPGDAMAAHDLPALDAGDWAQHTLSLDETRAIEEFRLAETEPAGTGGNVLYVDDVALLKGERVLWAEDFDTNGWQAAAADVGVEPIPAGDEPGAEPGQVRWVLTAQARGPGAAVSKSLTPYDLTTTRLLRCNLLNRAESAVSATVRVAGADGPLASQQVELPPGEWTQVRLKPEALPDPQNPWSGARSVRVTLPANAQIALDDVTFRRPPNVRYELYKFIHCTIPTLAGLLVMLIGVTVLRFNEVGYVIQWVKDKGWQREKPEELEEEPEHEAEDRGEE